MNVTNGGFDPSVGERHSDSSFRTVPWQVWIVVVLLAAEGILGNLPLIPSQPIAATWFAGKCLFIVGLIRRWRWVFVLFLAVAAIHVLAFSVQAPVAAVLNLVLVLLTASALRFYFPNTNATSTVSHTTRWFRYGLGTLLFMLLAGVGLNWFSWIYAQLDRARKQQVVVEAIKKAGPRVRVDYYTDPPAPFLRQIIGKDFCEVFAVDASSVRGFDDEYARYLAKLPKLQALALADTSVTDAGLRHLEGLSDLRYLWLLQTDITDAGLQHLRKLSQLQELDLKGTKVTEDGIRKLRPAILNCKIKH